MGENKITNLEQIGKINEHVRVRVFLSAGDVKTNCNDVQTLAALGEFVLYSQGVHPKGCI